MNEIEQILHIDYSYSERDESKLAPTLNLFLHELGGERKPYWGRKGVIDLVTFLELVISFVAGATFGQAIENYFAGLLRIEDAKVLGEQHRKDIDRWLQDVEHAFGKIVAAAKKLFERGFSFPHSLGKEQPLAIEIPLGKVSCYIVLNQPHVSQEALDKLPSAIVHMLRFIAEEGIPEDAITVQLFFDYKSCDWNYLLAPTPEGFGRFIDRVINIKTGESISITSVEQFIEFTDITPGDGFKFLVDPFYHHDKKMTE
jgi:hypothetical protein